MDYAALAKRLRENCKWRHECNADDCAIRWTYCVPDGPKVCASCTAATEIEALTSPPDEVQVEGLAYTLYFDFILDQETDLDIWEALPSSIADIYRAKARDALNAAHRVRVKGIT